MQGDGAAPDAGDIRQHLFRPLQVEAAPIALVIVAQHQAAVVVEQGDGDARHAIIVFGRQDGFADGPQVAAGQARFAVAAAFMHEQAQAVSQFPVQIVADETAVIVVAANLARPRQSFALDDVFPHAKAQVIGIDGQRLLVLARVRAHHVRMRLDGGQIQCGRQEVGFAQQPRMPVRGPAFVHDLAGVHGIEVKRLFAHGQKNVAFPVGQLRPMLCDEP